MSQQILLNPYYVLDTVSGSEDVMLTDGPHPFPYREYSLVSSLAGNQAIPKLGKKNCDREIPKTLET